MDKTALKLVDDYRVKQGNVLAGSFIVWKAKILQNWKYLISTNAIDGMYYELTYNGDKDEWYLDVYKKKENVVISRWERVE